MEVKNIRTELENAPLDTKAGIRLTKLTGDKTISVYAAEIAARTELRPHLHNYGIETYQILKGEGIMKTGEISKKTVIWKEVFKVEKGDCFCISEGMVHQLINESEFPLLVIFSCPESHLSNDRHFVNK